MISVDQALSTLLDMAEQTATESCALIDAGGRVLRATVTADRDQPPFDASAMDGYAICGGQPELGSTWTVVGESTAGHGYSTPIIDGQAVRIFTGAPLPPNADRVIIQENVEVSGNKIKVVDDCGPSTHIRSQGNDFKAGFVFRAPAQIGPAEIALLASMNVPVPVVAQRPKVAIISTGDELVLPGETPKPDQIFASNVFGLKVMFEAVGADVRLLPITLDRLDAITNVFELANDVDLIITVGGASVGDHDLIGAALDEMKFEKAFYKIKMRPGKPLMAAKRDSQLVIGLPGNPVSALVCGRIFVVPILKKMLGLADTARNHTFVKLAHNIRANGPREHYMRGVETNGEVTVFDRQDSALLSVFKAANVLVRRPVDDPPRIKGQIIEVLSIV